MNEPTNQQLLEAIDGLDKRFNKMDKRFDAVDERFDTLEEMVGGVGAIVETIAENYVTHEDLNELGDRLEAKIDEQARIQDKFRKNILKAAA